MSEELTRPSVNASERVDEGQEQQQSQGVEEEQEERNRNGSRKGDNDSRDNGEHHKNSTDQYSNASKSPQPTRCCRPPPSYSTSTVTRNCKRRVQRSNTRLSTTSSRQQLHLELEREEEQEEDHSNYSGGSDGDGNYIDGQDSNGSEGPRPAKRQKPSPSYGYSTSKRSGKVCFRLPHNGPSNIDKECLAPVRTRLERPSSSRYNYLQQFHERPSHSLLTNDEPTSSTAAGY